MKKVTNTNKKFYQKWTREQLIKELCRLNQLLKDCQKIIREIKKVSIVVDGNDSTMDIIIKTKKQILKKIKYGKI